MSKPETGEREKGKNDFDESSDEVRVLRCCMIKFESNCLVGYKNTLKAFFACLLA